MPKIGGLVISPSILGRSMLNYIRILSTAALSLLWGSNVSAELAALKCTAALKNDPRLVEQVQESYRSVKYLKAKFLQESTLAAFGDAAEQSSGLVWFEQPGKMRWDYQQPEPQRFLIKDRAFWHYRELDAQVTVAEFEEVFVSELPVSFLLGIGDLTRKFKLVEACRTSEGILLNLVPIDSADEAGLEQFSLLIDANSKLPKGARVVNVGGNIDQFLLSAIELRPFKGDEVFSEDFGARVYLDDRRKARTSTILEEQLELP